MKETINKIIDYLLKKDLSGFPMEALLRIVNGLGRA